MQCSAPVILALRLIVFIAFQVVESAVENGTCLVFESFDEKARMASFNPKPCRIFRVLSFISFPLAFLHTFVRREETCFVPSLHLQICSGSRKLCTGFFKALTSAEGCVL
jgi:hypothetical protein